MQKNQEYDRALFELSPVGLALCRKDGTLVEVNRAFAVTIGRTVEETLGLSYWEITPEKYADQEHLQLQTLEATGRYGPYEKEYIHKDGHLVPVRLRGLIVKREGEHFIWSSVEDITERRQSEELLRQAEERLRLAVKAANVGLFDWDLHSNKIHFSPEWKSQIGFAENEIDDDFEEWRSRVHPDDLEPTLKNIQAYLATPWPGYQSEFRFRHRDGSWRWILTQASLLHDEAGKPVRMLGSHLDITERKQIEDESKERSALLRLFIDHSPVALAMFDREMRYIAASRKWLADYGLGDQELTGRSHYEVFPEVPEMWKEIHRRCLAGATEKCEEDRFVRVDGRINWLRWEVRPWYLAMGEVGGIIIFTEDITGIKRAEEERQQVIERITDAFVALDKDWRYTYVNAKAAQVFGRRPEEMIGKQIWTEFPDGVGQKFHLTYEKAMAEQRPVYLEEYYPPYDRWFENHIYPSPEGVTIYFHDITDRKKMERALQESEEAFRATFEQAAVGMALVAPDGNWLQVNQRLCDIVGYTRDELLDLTFQDITYPDDLDTDLDYVRQMLAGDIDSYSMEKRYIRKDRSSVWINLTVGLVRDSAGKPAYFIKVVEDITERKLAEEAVRRERDFSETLIDSLPGVLYLYDQDLKFMRWNRNFERVLGYSADQIARMSPLDFFTGPDKELLRARILEVFATGASSVEAELIASDGTQTPYFFTGLRAELDDRVCLLGVGIDISARKKLEEELSLLNRDLEARVAKRTRELQENRLALIRLVEDLNEKSVELAAANEKLKEIDRLKSMFIASMSHELRTPLNSVIGYTSILLNGWLGPISPDQQEKMAIVLRAGKHLLSLISEVIDVSKIEAGQIETFCEEFDLFDLVAEAGQQLEADIHNKGLVFAVDNLHVRLKTDRKRLFQALLNILSNAMKYTTEGSVRLSASLNGSWVEITVHDTGLGISEQDAEKIFRPFTRFDSPLRCTTPGTGLGLYLTYRLVTDILKGAISFTSRVGQGTTFAIRVPFDACDV